MDKNLSPDLKEFRHWGQRAVGAFVLVIICVAVGFYSLLRTGEKKTEEGAYGNCHRTNITRAVENENNYHNYIVFKDVVTLSANNKTSSSTATEQQKKDGLEFIEKLVVDVNNNKWVPLTDCKQAVNNPFHYIPPAPVTFAEETPSAPAFHLGPNN